MHCVLAGVVLALLPAPATSTTTRPSSVALHALPSQWAAGAIVVQVRTATGAARAVLDTGGYTETKARHPRNFSTYYRGLPVSESLGPDYLRAHVVTIGTTRGRPEETRLEVRSVHGATYAFVSCAIGGVRYRLLFDTAAFAWKVGDVAYASPRGVVFLRSSAFARISRRSRTLTAYRVVDSRGRFVRAAAMLATVRCGGSVRATQLVERADPATYEWFSKTFGLQVDGDASLAAFQGSGMRIDFSNGMLTVWPTT